MLTFVFWNINRKPVANLIAALAHSTKADFIILAESHYGSIELTEVLNSSEPVYKFHAIRPQRLTFFSKFESFHRLRSESDYFSIQHHNLPGRPDFLLAMVHLPSRLYSSDASQMLECQHLADKIREVERRTGHHRTVLLGDLNSNPFDPGVVGANALHGVMSRQIAQKLTRSVHGQEYPFFYNPMWNHFGDENGVPGTYFYSRSEHVNYFWNMFDQALIRPALFEFLPAKAVEIVTTVNSISLLSGNGRPKNASDHLPIKLTLEM